MAILQAILGIAYPVLILAALNYLEPRQTAFIILGLTALRFLLLRRTPNFGALRAIALPAACVGAVVLFTSISNDARGLLIAPVLVNAALLATFGGSLFRGQPMVERFARIQVSDLSTEEIGYCRRVTLVWCAFFVGNGRIALTLAISGDVEAWAIFTGFISYLLIGMLFAVEFIYRHYRFRRYTGGLADPILMRFFPPRPTPAQAGDENGRKDAANAPESSDTDSPGRSAS